MGHRPAIAKLTVISTLAATLALVAGTAGVSAIAAAPADAAPLHSTTITINGASPGLPFNGVGAVAGGGGTARLLIDYPEPERSQILDYLFKPGYGANIQILKLEIGGDAEATDAAEPSFEHTKGHVNCDAGYEMWLARQAVARNPHIVLTALQWNAPGWVGHNQQNPWTTTDYRYLLDWLGCAKKFKLRIPYLGGWNEHLPHGLMTPQIMAWFIGLRAALDTHGYRYIKIVAVDSARRDPDISQYLAGHPRFNKAIGVLGYHDICRYPTTGLACTVPPAAKASGKPIWATEIGALRPPGGSAALGRTLNLAYIQGRAVAVLEYPLLTSMPGGMPEEDRGVVSANQPWSGYYEVPLTAWVTAQTTQFTAHGWLHVAGGDGQFGASYGTFVSYMGPSRKAWSMVAQTSDAPGPQTVTVHVTGGLATSTVHVWATDLETSESTKWFVRQPSITPHAGSFTTTLRKGYIYSFTTTAGQGKCGFSGIGIPAKSPCPAAQPTQPMPLPYSTTPSGTTWPQDAFGPDLTLEPWGLEAEDGSFEYPSMTSPYFTQTTAGTPDFWQPPGRRWISRFPYAVAGDYCLGDVPVALKGAVPSDCTSPPPANYTVSATVTFTKAGQSAGVIARYYRPVTTRIEYFQGYRFVVSTTGAWQLISDSLVAAPTVLAHGTYTPALGTGTPHTLSLMVSGRTLTPTIDGNPLSPVSVTNSAYSTGIAGICTGGWYPVQFDNVTVTRP